MNLETKENDKVGAVQEKQEEDKKHQRNRSTAKQQEENNFEQHVKTAQERYKEGGEEKTTFHPDQIQMFADCFQLFDKDHSGTIDEQELSVIMRSFGQAPTQEKLKAIIKEVDEDENGELDFLEFMKLMSRVMAGSNDVDELVKAFKVFDPEGKNHLSTSEFKHIMCNLGGKMEMDEWNKLIRIADPSSTGQIDYEKFAKNLLGPKGN